MEDCNQEWLKSNATATNGLVFCGLVQSSPQSFFGPMDQTLKLYCVHLSAGEVWFGLVWFGLGHIFPNWKPNCSVFGKIFQTQTQTDTNHLNQFGLVYTWFETALCGISSLNWLEL